MKDNNKTMNKTKEEIETLANQIWPSATDGTYNDLTKNFPHYRYGFIQAFEYYTDQIKSMEGQVKELREENEIQGNYNDMLIKELESLQKENERLYDALSNIMNNERWLEMNIDTVNNLLSKHA